MANNKTKGAHSTGMRAPFQARNPVIFKTLTTVAPAAKAAMLAAPDSHSKKERNMKKLSLICAALFALSLTACTEVGSDAWCADLKEKPKGDWTANEAGDFAKHCVFK